MAQWLRKHGTNRVFVRTKLLAKRPDMLAVDEEEAMRIRAQVAAGKVKAQPDPEPQPEEAADEEVEIQPVEDTPQEEAKKGPPNVAKMNEDDLRALAAERKIFLGPNWKLETLRKKVKEGLIEDSAHDAKVAEKIQAHK